METSTAEVIEEATASANVVKRPKKRLQVNLQYFKTRVCPFLASGTCRKGKSCTYAHAEDEVRTPPNLIRTKLCDDWQKGSCTDEKCRFAHGREQLRYTHSFYKTRLCHFWKSSGSCNKGEFCRHAHGSEELRKTTGPAPVEGHWPLEPNGDASDGTDPDEVAPEDDGYENEDSEQLLEEGESEISHQPTPVETAVHFGSFPAAAVAESSLRTAEGPVPPVADLAHTATTVPATTFRGTHPYVAPIVWWPHTKGRHPYTASPHPYIPPAGAYVYTEYRTAPELPEYVHQNSHSYGYHQQRSEPLSMPPSTDPLLSPRAGQTCASSPTSMDPVPYAGPVMYSYQDRIQMPSSVTRQGLPTGGIYNQPMPVYPHYVNYSPGTCAQGEGMNIWPHSNPPSSPQSSLASTMQVQIPTTPNTPVTASRPHLVTDIAAETEESTDFVDAPSASGTALRTLNTNDLEEPQGLMSSVLGGQCGRPTYSPQSFEELMQGAACAYTRRPGDCEGTPLHSVSGSPYECGQFLPPCEIYSASEDERSSSDFHTSSGDFSRALRAVRSVPHDLSAASQMRSYDWNQWSRSVTRSACTGLVGSAGSVAESRRDMNPNGMAGYAPSETQSTADQVSSVGNVDCLHRPTRDSRRLSATGCSPPLTLSEVMSGLDSVPRSKATSCPRVTKSPPCRLLNVPSASSALGTILEPAAAAQSCPSVDQTSKNYEDAVNMLCGLIPKDGLQRKAKPRHRDPRLPISLSAQALFSSDGRSLAVTPTDPSSASNSATCLSEESANASAATLCEVARALAAVPGQNNSQGSYTADSSIRGNSGAVDVRSVLDVTLRCLGVNIADRTLAMLQRGTESIDSRLRVLSSTEKARLLVIHELLESEKGKKSIVLNSSTAAAGLPNSGSALPNPNYLPRTLCNDPPMPTNDDSASAAPSGSLGSAQIRAVAEMFAEGLPGRRTGLLKRDNHESTITPPFNPVSVTSLPTPTQRPREAPFSLEGVFSPANEVAPETGANVIANDEDIADSLHSALKTLSNQEHLPGLYPAGRLFPSASLPDFMTLSDQARQGDIFFNRPEVAIRNSEGSVSNHYEKSDAPRANPFRSSTSGQYVTEAEKLNVYNAVKLNKFKYLLKGLQTYGPSFFGPSRKDNENDHLALLLEDFRPKRRCSNFADSQLGTSN